MTHFHRPVTPASVTSELAALCRSLVDDCDAVYVEVQPLVGAASNECFVLVDEQVDARGGQAVSGWALWEFPTLFVEAEFHCVWRGPDGRLIDIAPKRAEVARVLFLRDGRRRYEGIQVNNVRVPLRHDPVLIEYLATFDDEFALMNRGARAREHGEIVLEGSEALEHHDILDRREAAYFALAPSLPRVGPYHPCPCGSGRKVKWCHKALANAA